MKYLFFILFLSILALFLFPIPHRPQQPDEQSETPQQTAPTTVINILLVSPAFEPIEKAFIAQAATEWQQATNNIVKFYLVYDNNIFFPIQEESDNVLLQIAHIRPAASEEPVVLLLDFFLKGDTLGLYDYFNILSQSIKQLLIVRERIGSKEEYRQVLLHEIGHLNLEIHSVKPNTLMFPNATYAADCITTDDLKSFCEIFGCNYEEFSPCTFKDNAPQCLEP